MTSVLNDLFDYDGLKIYQYDDKFKFSLDSILLAEFVEIKPNTRTIVDFCTGNAPVPLILSTKTDARIYGFELQEKIYKLAKMSVKENKLESRINIINANLKDSLEYILPESVDAVTCNPPYFKYDKNKSLINENYEKAIARHEIEMNLEDLMIAAKYILKNKAPLYIVHRCDRLEEILDCLSKYNFKVKKLQFIYASYKKEAIMVLIKATKNGKMGSLKIMPPVDVLQHKSYKGIFE
ncbi:MAG TPA: methyltransferase [Candidatus Coprovivens excrementavium]|nr:methyltransferase [Candidatus Coprovivens excrementavium]